MFEAIRYSVVFLPKHINNLLSAINVSPLMEYVNYKEFYIANE